MSSDTRAGWQKGKQRAMERTCRRRSESWLVFQYLAIARVARWRECVEPEEPGLSAKHCRYRNLLHITAVHGEGVARPRNRERPYRVGIFDESLCGSEC